MNSNARLALAAVAVIAVGAAGAWFVAPGMPPSEEVSSSHARSTLPPASPSPAASHSALRAKQSPDASVDPETPSSDRLLWTRARLDQDWPAPVRLESVGGGPVVTMTLADDAAWDANRGIWDSFVFSDPVGDVAGDVAWVDIRKVGLGPGGVTAIGSSSPTTCRGRRRIPPTGGSLLDSSRTRTAMAPRT